MNYGDLVRDWR